MSKAKILLSQRKTAKIVDGCTFCDVCGCTKAITEKELANTGTNLPTELIGEICNLVNNNLYISNCFNHSSHENFSNFIARKCPLCKLNACESCWFRCKRCNLQICIDCNDSECGCKKVRHCSECDYLICCQCLTKKLPMCTIPCNDCQAITCSDCECDCTDNDDDYC